jgi:hypothetical protein
VRAGAPCDPKGELPIFASDSGCKYDVSCRGATGRNVFDERFTVVITAEINTRCHRVLRVRPVGESAAPRPRSRATVRGAGSYGGATSQAKRVTFSLRRGVVRNLTLGVRFTCTDNTEVGGNNVSVPKPTEAHEQDLIRRFHLTVADDRVNGEETIGAFPPLRTSRRGFAESLEAPNAAAIYDVSGRFSRGAWTGTARITEGWHKTNTEFGFVPDPDGEFVCDTGLIRFTAGRGG